MARSQRLVAQGMAVHPSHHGIRPRPRLFSHADPRRSRVGIPGRRLSPIFCMLLPLALLTSMAAPPVGAADRMELVVSHPDLFMHLQHLKDDRVILHNGDDIWTSDGTASGSRKLIGHEMLYPVYDEHRYSNEMLDVINGSLYVYTKSTDSSARQLIRYNGDQVQIISLEAMRPRGRLGNALILDANPGIWKVEAGQSKIVCISPTIRMDFVSHPREHNGYLYFNGDGSLWRTRGTPETTELVKKLEHYFFPTRTLNPNWFISNGDVLMFAGSAESLHGSPTYWRTDGTSTGTYVLNEEIITSLQGVVRAKPFVWNNNIYFNAGTRISGGEPWVSDGTREGTRMLKDIMPGINGSFHSTDYLEVSRYFHLFRDRLWFCADDGIHGYEVWSTDGTTSGTQLALDLTPGPEGPCRIWTVYRDHLILLANGIAYLSDGTAAGTRPIRDGRTGLSIDPKNVSPFPPLVLNNRLLFIENCQLWSYHFGDNSASNWQLYK